MHTPGHSSGEFCYLLPKQTQVDRPYVFTGDTLFIRDCGRTDLESGNDAEMFASLQILKQLDPDTVILVGHHYAKECASTLGEELKVSPPLKCASVSELSNLA
jgi:glyoxylase-like metal-dependent hydrolase (beta-lactamase superfamily II)